MRRTRCLNDSIKLQGATPSCPDIQHLPSPRTKYHMHWHAHPSLDHILAQCFPCHVPLSFCPWTCSCSHSQCKQSMQSRQPSIMSAEDDVQQASCALAGTRIKYVPCAAPGHNTRAPMLYMHRPARGTSPRRAFDNLYVLRALMRKILNTRRQGTWMHPTQVVTWDAHLPLRS